MSKDILDLQKIIKSGMERYLEDRGYSYNKASKKELGRAFLEFYVRDIGTYLYQFDEDLLEDGLRCDGSNDLNVDFAYKNEDIFYIIQSKFKTGKGSLERDEISGCFKIHSRVLDTKFSEAQRMKL